LSEPPPFRSCRLGRLNASGTLARLLNDDALSKLLLDLKQRGLLDETIVPFWQGQAGRWPHGGRRLGGAGRATLFVEGRVVLCALRGELIPPELAGMTKVPPEAFRAFIRDVEGMQNSAMQPQTFWIPTESTACASGPPFPFIWSQTLACSRIISMIVDTLATLPLLY
jgi:hypothetical protein